ncbi:MAG: hypothetical protein IBX41_05065 [Methanophagales archaeon]|nr:hypothetical protein [Methanophagales archaeon]
MEELYTVLNEIGSEAEKKVKRELLGHTGRIKALFYNLITPMVLNFQTERESYHFIFHKGGSVSLRRGLHNCPDVNVSGEHAELLYLLQNRDTRRFEIDERRRRIKVIPRSLKGRQAVMKLRELFL